MLVFKECEYIILEAGLGGEYDATAVFEKQLTLVTPIDMDHQPFLGDSIEEIATTKLNAIQNNAIIAHQKYVKIYEVINKLNKSSVLNIKLIDDFLNNDDIIFISEVAKELKLPLYLEQNLALSVAALRFFGIKYYKNNFKDSRLFGRLTQFRDNIIIDVGHNVLAAQSIVSELSPKKYILVYNSYKDKEYKKILYILKPIIRHVEIIEIDEQRIASIASLQKVLIELKIEYTKYNKINKSNNYLIFGSFSVAQSFLREYNG